MRFLVIGAGGVGGYFAARLAASAADVTVAARGEHGRVLKEHGLTLELGQTTEHVSLPKVGTIEEISDRFDAVLLAVKWQGLEQACDELPRLLAPHGVVLPFLNGLDSEEVVARYVGAQRTLAAVAYMSSGILAPGRIYAHGNTRAALACFRPGQETELEGVATALERAGIPVRRHHDYRSMLWEKMVWNAPFNAICGLTDKPAGQTLTLCEDLVRKAMREVIAVGKADGATLADVMVEVMLQLTRSEYPLTEPSMLQDLRAGRSTEVDILQGAVVERGEKLGIGVPVMRTLRDLVRARSAARA